MSTIVVAVGTSAQPLVSAISSRTPTLTVFWFPRPGYLAGVRALCDRHGIVYIADEVMAGFGRIGEWFAVNAFDVVPD